MDWRAIGRVLFPKRMIEPDVKEEIAFHIEERIRELVALGWMEEEARRHVLARFGDVDRVEAACREYDAQRVDGETWRRVMDAWWRDVRFAARSMRRNAGFSGVVALTLALGIGATTSVFSVVEGILLRPLPYPEPDELVMVWQNDRATGTVRENASIPDYYDYVERSRSFDGLAMYALGSAVFSRTDAGPLQLNRARVTRNLAEVLQVDMQLGRPFTPEEDIEGGPRVVMLTDHFWRSELGADPRVIGSSLTIDDESHEVVGILPKGIDFPANATDIWLPIQTAAASASRAQHGVSVVARLADGTGVDVAQAEMTRIMADLEVEYAAANVNRGAFVERLSDVGRADLRLTLWVLFASVLAVLAIACVNAANLLLARGAGRSRELAVLSAVGAGSSQITRRFFLEGALITAVAATGGIALAALGVRVLTAIAPAELLLLGEPSVNAEVLTFVLAIAVPISIGFALVPTLQARRLNLQDHLKDGRNADAAASGFSVRRLLVAGQLSLAVVLLLGATLLIGTLRNLQSIDPGFVAANTLRVDYTIPQTRYPRDFSTYPNWPEVHAFNEALIRGVEAIPGVRSAAIVLNHPLDPGFTNSFQIEGQPYDPSQGEMTTRLITPGYFETVGLKLVEGRLLNDVDRVGAPDAMVLNRQAVARYFPEGGAIGSRIAFWGRTFREVVGIVENERIHGLTADVPPAMYVSMLQSPPIGGRITLMARTEVPPLTVVEGVRAAMRDVDPDVPIYNVATMESTVADAMARERFASTVLSIFAAVAVFLALLGVHGVLAYLVSQRGHEVGVRMALGATRSDVVRMIVRQGAAMTVLGITIGLLAAAAFSGLLQGLLYGVSATSPRAYAVVGVTLGLVAMAATALPAHRAASIDPVSSLRGE